MYDVKTDQLVLVWMNVSSQDAMRGRHYAWIYNICVGFFGRETLLMIRDYNVTTVDFTIRHILHHRLSRKCTLTGWTTNMAQNDTEANLTELFHELSWT